MFLFPLAKINDVEFNEDQDDNITFDDFEGDDEDIDEVSLMTWSVMHLLSGHVKGFPCLVQIPVFGGLCLSLWE